MSYPEPLEGVVGGGTEAQSVIDFVTASVPTETKIPNVYLYANGVVADLRSYTDPTRARQGRLAFTTASFVDLVLKEASDESVLFYSQQGGRFMAVLDYSTADKPTRDEHTIFYAPPLDPAWQSWAAIHGKPIAQADFADFVEEHLDEITSPDAADLLELVQDVRGHKNVTWEAGHKLSNGAQRLEWKEEQTVRGGKGETTVPATLELSVPIHRGEDPVAISAWLRYHISNDGKLSFTVKLKRSAYIVPEALDRMRDTIATETARPVVAGWHEG